MDPIKYARALKLTYSRLLSPEEVRPFLDAHYNGDREALGVLKDRFQDEGDPRGDIWDRHHGLTKSGLTGYGVDEHLDHVYGPPPRFSVALGEPDSEEGRHTFRFTPIGHWQNGKKVRNTAVSILHSHDLEPESVLDWHHLSHKGVFTPAEARSLADKFPEEHAQQIHQFLDTHFGPRPDPE